MVSFAACFAQALVLSTLALSSVPLTKAITGRPFSSGLSLKKHVRRVAGSFVAETNRSISPFSLLLEPTPNELNHSLYNELSQRLQGILEDYIGGEITNYSRSENETLKYFSLGGYGGVFHNLSTTLYVNNTYASFAAETEGGLPTMEDLDEWVEQAINTEFVPTLENTTFHYIRQSKYISGRKQENSTMDNEEAADQDTGADCDLTLNNVSIACVISGMSTGGEASAVNEEVTAEKDTEVDSNPAVKSAFVMGVIVGACTASLVFIVFRTGLILFMLRCCETRSEGRTTHSSVERVIAFLLRCWKTRSEGTTTPCVDEGVITNTSAHEEKEQKMLNKSGLTQATSAAEEEGTNNKSLDESSLDSDGLSTQSESFSSHRSPLVVIPAVHGTASFEWDRLFMWSTSSISSKNSSRPKT